MSMPMKIECTCAVCKKESNQTILVSTNQFGTPDLDLRPPKMMRSTMAWWIQECPYCGYVSKSIDDLTSVDECWLKSDSYMETNGIVFKSDLAKKFYKYYLINIADNSIENAFYATLHAAWECDDSKDNENAIICRKLALEQLDILISDNNYFSRENEKDNDEFVESIEKYHVMRIDLLRRSKQFSRVIEEYSKFEFSFDLFNKIKAFQIACAQQQDTGCYIVANCID